MFPSNITRTSMTITDTDNDQLNFEKFSGSGEIRTHDLRVTSLLLDGAVGKASASNPKVVGYYPT